MRNTYKEKHGGDWYDKIGILGERSVQHILYQTHFMLELHPQGVELYAVYSTREEKYADYQTQEIDLIEEWKDAAGKKHKKAHEVKCEPSTLEHESGSEKLADDMRVWFASVMKNKPITIEDNKEQEEQKEQKKQEEPEEDWTPKPTGNYIVEDNLNGWLYKVRNSKKFMEDKGFTDGRDIWFVSYVPKPKQRTESIKDPETGDEYCVDPTIGRQPERGFPMLSIPDEKLIRFIDANKKQLKSMFTQKGKYKLPMWKLYPDIFMDEKTQQVVFGVECKETGAKLFLDWDVWKREKSPDETWTEEDLKIEIRKTF